MRNVTAMLPMDTPPGVLRAIQVLRKDAERASDWSTCIFGDCCPGNKNKTVFHAISTIISGEGSIHASTALVLSILLDGSS